MKINIQKFQLGGGGIYKPLPMVPRGEAPPKPAEEPLEANLLEGMLGEGLSNDVMAYSAQLNDAYNNYASMPEDLRRSYQGQMIRRKLKGDVGTLNYIKKSKKDLEDLATQKKDALNDFAMHGNSIIAKDAENNIVNLSFGEYYSDLQSNAPKFEALTNSDVLQLRREDPRFVGKNNVVIPILQQAISTDDVIKKIKDNLIAFGSYSKGTSEVSFEEQKVQDGANTILKSTEGSLQTSNAENIKAAANAVWGLLDDNAKNLLRMKAMQYKIYKPEEIDNAAMGLGLSFLKMGAVEKSIGKSGETPAKNPGASSGKDNLKGEKNWWVGVADGGHTPGTMQIVIGNSLVSVKGGLNPGGFMKSDQKTVYENTTLDKIDPIRTITDMNNVSFGDTHVDFMDINKLVVLSKDSMTVGLPWKSDANGNIVPDLLKGKHYIQAQDDIKKVKEQTGVDASPSVKAAIYAKYDFNNLDPNGDPLPEVLKPFLIFDAYANNKMFGGTIDNVIEDTSDKTFKNYSSFFMERSGLKEKTTYPELDTTFGSKAHILKGVVYIPIKRGPGYNAMYAGGTQVKVPEEENAERTYQNTSPSGMGNNEVQQSWNKNFGVETLGATK